MDHPTPIDPRDLALYSPDKMGKSTIFRSDRVMVGLNAFEPGQEHALQALLLTLTVLAAATLQSWRPVVALLLSLLVLTRPETPIIVGAIAQDQAAWVIEGKVMDRTTERLGVSDVGVIMFRRMLEAQMRLVEAGEGDPLNTYRDPAENEIIRAPCEGFDYFGYEGIARGPFVDIQVHNDVEVDLSGEGAKLAEWSAV